MTERTYKKDLEVITVVGAVLNFLVLLPPPTHRPPLVLGFWCAGFQGQSGSPRLCASSPAHEVTQVFEFPLISHIIEYVHSNSQQGAHLPFR